MPTRLGRHGVALVPDPEARWRVDLVKSSLARQSAAPILDGCPCPACRRGYSRGYLHYLLRAGELTALRLVTLHNLSFIARLMADLRTAIAEGRLGRAASALRGGAAPGELPSRCRLRRVQRAIRKALERARAALSELDLKRRTGGLADRLGQQQLTRSRSFGHPRRAVDRPAVPIAIARYSRAGVDPDPALGYPRVVSSVWIAAQGAGRWRSLARGPLPIADRLHDLAALVGGKVPNELMKADRQFGRAIVAVALAFGALLHDRGPGRSVRRRDARGTRNAMSPLRFHERMSGWLSFEQHSYNQAVAAGRRSHNACSQELRDRDR